MSASYGYGAVLEPLLTPTRPSQAILCRVFCTLICPGRKAISRF